MLSEDLFSITTIDIKKNIVLPWKPINKPVRYHIISKQRR